MTVSIRIKTGIDKSPKIIVSENSAVIAKIIAKIEFVQGKDGKSYPRIKLEREV